MYVTRTRAPVRLGGFFFAVINAHVVVVKPSLLLSLLLLYLGLGTNTTHTHTQEGHDDDDGIANCPCPIDPVVRQEGTEPIRRLSVGDGYRGKMSRARNRVSKVCVSTALTTFRTAVVGANPVYGWLRTN